MKISPIQLKIKTVESWSANDGTTWKISLFCKPANGKCTSILPLIVSTIKRIVPLWTQDITSYTSQTWVHPALTADGKNHRVQRIPVKRFHSVRQWRKKREKFHQWSRFWDASYLSSVYLLPPPSYPPLCHCESSPRLTSQSYRVTRAAASPMLLFCCFDPALSEPFLKNRPPPLPSFPGCCSVRPHAKWIGVARFIEVWFKDCLICVWMCVCARARVCLCLG